MRLITSILDKGVDVNARVKEFPPQRRHLLPLASLEWVDFTGQTAFIRAAQSADVAVMKLLLSKGGRPGADHLQWHVGVDDRGRCQLGGGPDL
jgi:ankyrin repeat protein